MAKGNNKTANGSALDFEAQLWAAADKMRGHMDASEYRGARPEGLSHPKSEWFIKDEPQRADEFPIPTGLRHSAQGCRGPRPDWPSEATLGNVIHYFPRPQRGCANRACADGCNPFRNLCKSPKHRSAEHCSARKSPQTCGAMLRAPLPPPSFAEISFRVDELLGRFPRVAPRQSGSDQPWAECHYPVGVNEECRADLPPDLKADLVPVRKDLANPPFNLSDWGGENLRQDVRFFPLSASNGERAGVRCRNFGVNRSGVQNFRGQRWPCASTTTCMASSRRATEHAG